MTDSYNEQPKPSPDDQIKFLWDVIKRIDFYNGTLNFKGGLLITYNAAVVGYVLIKSDVLLTGISEPCLLLVARILLSLAGAATIVSLVLTLKVVFPFLESSSTQPQSLIFFKDVAAMESDEVYRDRFRRADGHALVDELAGQVFVVAKGASAKFRWIGWAVSALFWIQLPGLALFAAIKILG